MLDKDRQRVAQVVECTVAKLLRGPLAVISLSNFPESLLNPVKELYFRFTGVTIGFFHLDVIFGHGVTSNPQNKVSSCFRV
jgi:hypothetical protein